MALRRSSPLKVELMERRDDPCDRAAGCPLVQFGRYTSAGRLLEPGIKLGTSFQAQEKQTELLRVLHP